MSDYPEALIERTARAMFTAEWPKDAADWEDPGEFNEQWRGRYRRMAPTVLDSLGFAPYVGSQYWRSAIHVEDYK